MSRQLERGVVGYWCPMLATTGPRLYDRSGRSNHGTLTNMVPASDWVTAKVRNTGGRVLDFDGTNDYVGVPDSPNLRITGSITVACWFRRNATQQNRGLIGKYDVPSNQRAWALGTQNSIGGAGLFFTTQPTGAAFDTNQQAIYTTDIGNGWNHAIGRLVAGSPCEIWLNGALVATAAAATNAIFANTTALEIGRYNQSAANAFAGQIAEACIWNRAITPGEIRTLYRIGPGWFGKRESRFPGYAEQAAGFKAYWARRQSQLIGGGV
jgi:Concanavalin A-like lectin/glucanases superfamily